LSLGAIVEAVIACRDVGTSAAFLTRAFGLDMLEQDGPGTVMGVRGVGTGRIRLVPGTEAPDPRLWDIGPRLLGMYSRDLARTVRLIDEDGALLGPGLQILRAAPDRLAPACLAGFIRIAALRHARSRTQTVPQRLDLQRIELPRLPLPDQHRLGEMFTRLQAFEDALAGLAESGSTLLEGALQGLGEGTLCVSS